MQRYKTKRSVIKNAFPVITGINNNCFIEYLNYSLNIDHFLVIFMHSLKLILVLFIGFMVINPSYADEESMTDDVDFSLEDSKASGSDETEGAAGSKIPIGRFFNLEDECEEKGGEYFLTKDNDHTFQGPISITPITLKWKERIGTRIIRHRQESRAAAWVHYKGKDITNQKLSYFPYVGLTGQNLPKALFIGGRKSSTIKTPIGASIKVKVGYSSVSGACLKIDDSTDHISESEFKDYGIEK